MLGSPRRGEARYGVRVKRFLRTLARRAFALTALGGLLACGGSPTTSPNIDHLTGERRTPAEWEPQAAVWLQWPQAYEGEAVQSVFVSIAERVAEYEPVVLLAADEDTLARGRAALAEDANITWHVVPNDNSWMRDSGPRYVEVDGALVAQNWEFDAWGGGFGRSIPYAADNALPDAVAELIGLPVERVGLVHERGDLEVNGVDTALVSWSVLSHRNPGLTRARVAEVISRAHGVDSVIFIEGFDPRDGTRGHVDGAARFVDRETIVVAEDGGALFDGYAGQIAEQRPDLKLVRMALPAGAPTMNWLIGNGFVLVGASGDEDVDERVADQLRSWYPSRDVLFIDVGALWENGGGIHCVTNDEPARP